MRLRFLCNAQAADLDFVSGLLGKETTVRSLKPCSRGCDCFAFELNRRRIVRFPKNINAYNKLCKEQNVLAFIGSRCPLRIPQTTVNKNGQYVYGEHRKIVGNTLTSAQFFKLPLSSQQKFCADLAAFMASMHTLTPEISQTLKLPPEDCFEKLAPPEKLSAFYGRSCVLPPEKQADVRNFLKNYRPALAQSPKVFGHFDLRPDNLAFSRSSLSLNGVFGFGNCGIGNIYDDFSRLALDYDIVVVAGVAEEYHRRTGWKPDVRLIVEAAVYNRLVFYCRRPDAENLKLLVGKIQSLNGGAHLSG